MLSRDSYPSNIASLLLSWPYLCLLLASLKSHKNQGTHRKLRLYQHWSYFLWWQARQLFSLCHRCFWCPLDIMFTDCLSFSGSHHSVIKTVFKSISPNIGLANGGKENLTGLWQLWFIAVLGKQIRKEENTWRPSVAGGMPLFLGTLTYYHKKMWHQFGSRQAASGLLWGEVLHSNNAGEETHLLKWLWPLTSDCTASVCCYCYEDRWCPHDIGLMIQVMGRVKPFVVIVNSGSYVVQAW